MATIKVKFRPSSVPDREGSLYYQVIHNRVARQIKTGYRLHLSEWLGWAESTAERVVKIRFKVEEDLALLARRIADFDSSGIPYTAADVVRSFYSPRPEEESFFSFMRGVAEQMRRAGKIRIAETYTSALNSFCRFRMGVDLAPNSIDSDMMRAYEAYLRAEGLCKNTSSFYMRNLRAVYNRAVERGLTVQRMPFRHVYTGIDRTVKRAIPLDVLRRIRNMDLSARPDLALARDMFMFSFFTRGMSFIDMSFLRRSDIDEQSILVYRRKKTGQRLMVRWEPCMQEIVDRYLVEGSPYLLPIVKPDGGHERRQYQNMLHLINKRLKIIGRRLKLPVPLTMYVARHGWASIARSKRVPISVISEGMGHDSETTTRIYLASLDTSSVDRANRMILNSL